jgi:branched-chain amino acid transport system substrate-binding protein
MLVLLCWLSCVSVALAAAPPITIGLSLGLSGKYQQLGLMQQRGYLLWQRQLNERGGLLGRPVELLIRDDQSDPATAARIYRELISEDKVDLIFGPYSSGITAAVAPVVEEFHYPLLASGASADSLWEQGYHYLFGVYTPAQRYGVGFLEMLLRSGIKDVAIVSADDDFSRSIATGTRIWADRYALKVTFFETFAKGARDLTAVARRAAQTGAGALLVCGHFNEAVDMRRALDRIDWTPKAYYASVGPVLSAYGEKLEGLAERSFSSSHWEATTAAKFPGGGLFLAEFLQAYRTEPSYQGAAAYAAGQILEKAVKRVGSLDREALTRALSGMDAMTILGRYGVDNSGLQIRHFPLIIQWQNGAKEVVWPPEFATAQPLF